VKRLIVGISGASGAIYGIRLLQVLREVDDVETHLVLTPAARRTVPLETDLSVRSVEALADYCYRPTDIAAAISSGSFRTEGMVVVPCSMKTLSGIATSYSGDLLLRAADVTLKERRRLVLLVRETPLHLGHLRLLVDVAEGREFTLRYGDGVSFRWRVSKLNDGSAVSWECTAGPGAAAGSTVTFELSDTGDGRTAVELAHTGWPDGHQALATCNTLWGILLGRLRNYAETSQPPDALASSPAA